MSTFSTSSRQKRLKTLSFLHFWLRNVLCATTACTFSTLFRHLNLQKWSEHGVFCTFWLRNVLRTTTACTFSTSQLPKVVRTWCVLYILTSKCASRHNRVHFFNISTAKSGPDLVCFVHFDFEMCFALRSWCVLYILTWKCASRHNGVQFFISHLASWLRTRRFSEPTFRPTGATNHWKNTVFRDFPTFSRICIFFLLILSLLTLLTSAFQLSILSEVSLLNFLRLSCFGEKFFGRPSSLQERRWSDAPTAAIRQRHADPTSSVSSPTSWYLEKPSAETSNQTWRFLVFQKPLQIRCKNSNL